MSRKHAKIEQLDGNTSLPYDSSRVSEKADEEIEHFLQYGFIRDPSVRNYGQQLRICIGDELRNCGLSWEERQPEFKLINASLGT